MSSVTERQDCRACHGQLESIFHFGEHEIVNFGDKDPVRSPLELMKCQSCHLVQLHHTVNPDLLFRKYYYKSGVNQTMRNHLQSIVEDCMKRVELKAGDIVLDIGANDGTLLRFYPKTLKRRGYEPSEIIPENDENFDISQDYFSASDYYIDFEEPEHDKDGKLQIYVNPAKIITAIAMFYDLNDPGKFLDDVKQVLAPDGLFVIEMNYLPAMLEGNRVDNISAEHLCYYSLASLRELLHQHGFYILDVALDEINGGVFRVYARSAEEPKYSDSMALMEILDREEKLQLDKIETYHKFIRRVLTNMSRLRVFIEREARGLKVDVYGASTRGLMLMQLAQLNESQIRQAVERNPAKVGTKYNGIPVVDEQTMRDNPPHYLLILAPDFIVEQLVREMQFLRNGGKMILPFPEPRILSLESI